MLLGQAQQAIQTNWVAVYSKLGGSATPSVAGQAPPPTGPGPAPAVSASGHTYYASSFGTAHNIYCDTDSGWRSLSKTYLVSSSSLEEALATLPGYALRSLTDPSSYL